VGTFLRLFATTSFLRVATSASRSLAERCQKNSSSFRSASTANFGTRALPVAVSFTSRYGRPRRRGGAEAAVPPAARSEGAGLQHDTYGTDPSAGREAYDTTDQGALRRLEARTISLAGTIVDAGRSGLPVLSRARACLAASAPMAALP